jgi:hypothetical protein
VELYGYFPVFCCLKSNNSQVFPHPLHPIIRRYIIQSCWHHQINCGCPFECQHSGNIDEYVCLFRNNQATIPMTTGPVSAYIQRLRTHGTWYMDAITWQLVSGYDRAQHTSALPTFLEATINIKLICRMTDIMCFHLAALIIAFTGEETVIDRGECLSYASECCYSRSILLRPASCCCAEHFFEFTLTDWAFRYERERSVRWNAYSVY